MICCFASSLSMKDILFAFTYQKTKFHISSVNDLAIGFHCRCFPTSKSTLISLVFYTSLPEGLLPVTYRLCTYILIKTTSVWSVWCVPWVRDHLSTFKSAFFFPRESVGTHLPTHHYPELNFNLNKSTPRNDWSQLQQSYHLTFTSWLPIFPTIS